MPVAALAEHAEACSVRRVLEPTIVAELSEVLQKGETLAASALRRRRILVVEDEFLIAMDLEMALQAAQATVLGPVARVRAALELIAREAEISAAILDVNVGSEPVFPVADALLGRSVPFVFATGEPLDAIPQRFADVVLCRKPNDATLLVRQMADLLAS